MSVKARLRDGIANLLYLTGLTAPARRGRGRLSIVTFHRVLSEVERQHYPYPGLVVTSQELDAFLTYLTAHFDCGTLATQHERYLHGELSGRPLLALTFDDGQHDNYLNARPVLAHHRVKATFFIPVAAVERKQLLWHDRLGFAVRAMIQEGDSAQARLMRILGDAGLSCRGARSLVENAAQESKGLALKARLTLVQALADASCTAPIPEFARIMSFEEIAELASDGHEIGSHSMTHCLMPECDDSALAYELAESRLVLRTKCQQPIESFCYPNGNFDVRTANAVAKAGYRRAVTTRWGHNGLEENQYQLRRCDMNVKGVRDGRGKFSPATVAFRMSGFYPGLH